MLISVRLYERIWVYRHRAPLALGQGSRIHRSAQILGRKNVRIGINSCVSERCWLNVNHRAEDGFSISIGDNTFIGRENFLTSGRSISIGNYCLTAMSCKFICSTHLAETPWLPIISTGTSATDEISIGDNCFFGASATVLGNVKIGHGSVIGAGSLVTSDVPPFSLAIGSPAKVIKRYSFKQRSWIPVSALAVGDLDENPSSEAYTDQLKLSHPRVDIPWIASGIDQGSF